MPVTQQVDTAIDWAKFARARAELGGGFTRILGYFREDGAKSIAAIEQAMKSGAAAPLVLPAHKLKTEAAEFGAVKLSKIAEHIEMTARDCVERHMAPGMLMEDVADIRPLLEATLAELDAACNPLMNRRPVTASGFSRSF